MAVHFESSVLPSGNFVVGPAPGPDNINWPALWCPWGQVAGAADLPRPACLLACWLALLLTCHTLLACWLAGLWALHTLSPPQPLSGSQLHLCWSLLGKQAMFGCRGSEDLLQGA